MIPALAALGHRDIKVRPHGTFKANAIEWVGSSDGRGHWAGGADPRSEGVAVSQ